LKGKPFALIGVNVTGNDAKELNDVMDREKLNWRSFADPGDILHGGIAAKWNVTGTPTLYVIDHKGVIRHKWTGSPGAEAIDTALEKLIAEAERSPDAAASSGTRY
jgi:peroxiredoxin